MAQVLRCIGEDSEAVKFEVRTLEHESDYWKKFEAVDAGDAAEQWAEWEDSAGADYLIVSGRSTPTVEVRDPEGALTRWTLTGESVPLYRARLAVASTGGKNA